MSGPDPHIYDFADFRVDPGQRLLLHGGVQVAIPPKVFDTLLLLVRQQGKILEKQELLLALWPDTAVEENNLTQHISTLRRILGDTRAENRFVATISGFGYRFIAPVEVLDAVSQGQEPTRIAVLPFENLGAGPEREYLADGLTEETIVALGQIDPLHLTVIGRTSVMRYKRTPRTLAEIGEELKAAYLIESSLRAEGDRLRITSKLIRVSDQLQIWCASYESEPVSMFAFQRELSVAIAEQVRLRLSPSRISALGRRQTQSPEAYDLYLHGRHFWNQLTGPTTRRAIEYFTRATNLDPHYALAWAGLADCYSSLPIHADIPPLVIMEKARDAVANALAADPNLAEVQTALGIFKFFLDWDWSAAEDAYRRAIVLDPNYPLVHRMLGIDLSHACRHSEARSAMQRARELDPLYVMHQSLSSQIAFAARDFAAAAQFARQAIVIDPEFWIAQLHLAQVSVESGDYEVALDALNKSGCLSVRNSKILSLRGYIFGKMGRSVEAFEIIQTLEAIGRECYVPPYATALVHAGLGQEDLALERLERALQLHDVHLIFLPIDPKWDRFRSNPRFIEVLHSCAFYAYPGSQSTLNSAPFLHS